MIIRRAKRLRGRVTMPGDKSISHRGAMIAALATGTSRIKNFSTSADCAATLSCLRELGVTIEHDGHDVLIRGAGAEGLRAPSAPLDCRNSGTTMRLLAGILAGHNFRSVLTGDESLRARPMQRIIEPLNMMGANISARAGRAPLTIDGRRPLHAISYELPVASAQVKSCLLFAGLNAAGKTEVIENDFTRDHTERMLGWFNVPIDVRGDHEGPRIAALNGPVALSARGVSVPGDISSAAYFIAAAALLSDSLLEVANVGVNPTRVLFLKQMRSLGLDVTLTDVREECNEPIGTICARGWKASPPPVNSDSTMTIQGSTIPRLIDELPLLAVIASQIQGGITIRDAQELRVKESDRIATMVENLRAMGTDVDEFDDGLRVYGPTRLRGASVNPRGDHRIAMAFTVAGLIAEGETTISDAGCVAVSFPEFFELLDSVVER